MEPFRLQPVFKSYLWGGNRLKREFHKQWEQSPLAESWELCCHRDGENLAADGPLQGQPLSQILRAQDGLLGSRFPAGKDPAADFPLLIKLIDAKEQLSVQVHPGDQYAMEQEGQPGKTEVWYILDAQPGAALYYGFERPVTRETFARSIYAASIQAAGNGGACILNTDTPDTSISDVNIPEPEVPPLTQLLHRQSVQPGEVYFIPSGTVHAIGAGILVAEIQQNSNLTYRVYDYNRRDAQGNLRPLHTAKALEVARLEPTAGDGSPLGSPVPVEGGSRCLLSRCGYFALTRLDLSGRMAGRCGSDSFQSLLAVSGNGSFTCGGYRASFQAGDSFFLPAGCGEYQLEGEAVLLCTTL